MERPGLILVGGSPASGKTTLASSLAETYRLPLLSRDALKEALMDEIGSADRGESERLGRASFTLLFIAAERLLAAGVTPIVDCNFSAGIADAEWRPFVERARAVHLFCHAPLAECRRRFLERARSGRRHAGHHDASAASLADFDAGIRSGRYRPLDLGVPVLTVNTADGYDPTLEAIIAFIAPVAIRP